MQGFKSSINLQFDLTNHELLHRYLLSTSHSEVLRGILESLTTTKGMHSHLLVGPYGTGKSLVATIVCQMLSKIFEDDWMDRLLEQADRFDRLLADQLQQIQSSIFTYIPVVINGKTGELRKIINTAIYRSVQQAGISIATPNEVHTIVKTVERWKQSYPGTYEAFLEHIKANEYSESDWIKQIEGYNEEVIQQFVEFYPSVTSGTKWVVEQEENFVENIERMLDELRARNTGIIIVYDEFGRFLQSLNADSAMKNMQDLQDLAELANNSNNLQLLVVGHKHIRQYAAQSKEFIRTEFEKVEKRFRFYSLETDSTTYLRLAHDAGAEINASCMKRATQLVSVAALQGIDLFREFTPYQLEKNIIRGLYPLHPVAVVLLPYLSNIFGQNERTLFSFFGDDERYGLRDHSTQEDGYYYADKLFHYFSIGDEDQLEHPNLLLYRKIEPYLIQQAPIQRRIAQILTLWSVGRLSQKQAITSEFIAFTLGVSQDQVNENLAQLTSTKIIRYNQIREQWELYDGSSIDVDHIITNKLPTTNLSQTEVVEILEKHLPTPYILPYEYNDQMYMLRSAAFRFVRFADVKDWAWTRTTADDQILLILFDNEEQIEQAASFIAANSFHDIYALPKFTMEQIKPSLKQYAIIDDLLHDTAFLAQDARLKNELQYLLQQTGVRVRSFVENYFAYGKLEWWSGAEIKKIEDSWDLENLVSVRMRNEYPDTPHIRNEAFNRNKISSVQKRAVVDVIDRLIRMPDEPSLGISGYGPNYLIYASVLKNNGYQYSSENGVQCSGSLQGLRRSLLNVLKDKPTGNLTELVGIFQAKPYGIRSAVIPVLFVALLRDQWDQLMFYSNDMLTTHLSGDSVCELLEKAREYDYRHFELTVEERSQLIKLGQYFGLLAEECNSFIHVANVMLTWLRGLPKFAQITNQLSNQTLQIRDFIRAAEMDPYRNMILLISMESYIAQAKEEMENFLTHNEAELEKQLLYLTRQQTKVAFIEGLEQYRVSVIGMNSKLLTVPNDFKDEKKMLNTLVKHFVGVERIDWSDATQELFMKQIQYEWQLLNSRNEVAVDTEVRFDSSYQFSRKSQLLYTNVKNLLKYAGKDVSPQELKQLLMKLLQEV